MRRGCQVPQDKGRRTATLRRLVPGTFLATALFSAAFVPGAGATGVAAGSSYVALGDSYASGPDIPVQSGGSCMRSSANYPSDTAKALSLTLTDESCSGATTLDVISSQLGGLSNSTAVVSVQVGGDDLGFVSILENCAALTPWGPTKVGANCKNYYDPNGDDSLGAMISGPITTNFDNLLGDIHTDAKNAQIFVLGYPAILPGSGGACWPSMPFETGDAQYLRGVEVALNAMLKTQAGLHGATYVDTYTPSLSYNACTSKTTRWIEPIVPSSPAAPVHPNATGEAGMAKLLETAIG